MVAIEFESVATFGERQSLRNQLDGASSAKMRRQKGAWLRFVFERAIAAPLVRDFSNVVHGLAGLRLSLEP